MQNTLLIGLSRQVALQRELDIVSNNIANLNTSGYKADGAVFEEFLSPVARAATTQNRISFVHDRATWHDLSQGTLEQTGNPLDVALQGSGFLVVQTPRGERYTDLANRVLFRERLDEALTRLRRHGEAFSLFVFDLDMFKAVNDSLGHPVGDTLLRMVADRLRMQVRDVDTVGRLGGDEFAIIQAGDPNHKESAVALANRLLEAVSQPYQIDNNEVVIATSIGIALAPHDGNDADELLKNADLALYRAKSEGRKDFRFFEAQMDSELRLRRALEIDLRHALAREEFEIHYQPVIDARTRKPDGAEALIRWRHPHRGLVSPDKFIPLAEETGLIIQLGQWILRQACTDAVKWPDHIRLAVNLSSVQFRNGDLVEVVRHALSLSGLAANRLELEITESVLLQKNAGTLDMLHGLKQLGVGIVLDDFGTGYSSYLRAFPFDKIKIDRSFVAEMPVRDDCAAIVAAITSLARSLDIETTAEGVETHEQFALLRAVGCSHAQGYLFSRPVPAAAIDFSKAGQNAALGNANKKRPSRPGRFYRKSRRRLLVAINTLAAFVTLLRLD